MAIYKNHLKERNTGKLKTNEDDRVQFLQNMNIKLVLFMLLSYI